MQLFLAFLIGVLTYQILHKNILNIVLPSILESIIRKQVHAYILNDVHILQIGPCHLGLHSKIFYSAGIK